MNSISSDDLYHIFSFLDFRTTIKCQSVCRKWRDLVESELRKTKVLLTPLNKQLKSWSSCSASDHRYPFIRYSPSTVAFKSVMKTASHAMTNLTALKLYKCEIHWSDLVELSHSTSWICGSLNHVEFCYSFFILRNYFNEDSVKILMRSRNKGVSHLVFIGNNEMGTYTVYPGQTELLFKNLLRESRAEIEELACDDFPGIDAFIQSLKCTNLKKIEKNSASGLISSVSASYSANGNELDQVQIVWVTHWRSFIISQLMSVNNNFDGHSSTSPTPGH